MCRVIPKVQDLLLKVAQAKGLKPIYKRNIILAKLSAAFTLEANDQDDVDNDNKPSSARLQELLLYVGDQKTSIACFSDIKEFAEKLDASGLKHLAYVHVPELAKTCGDPAASARVHLLSLKLRYLLTTCPVSRTQVAGRIPASKCVICDSVFESVSCHACLAKISSAALEAYKSATDELKDDATVQGEVLPELALAVALCNMQMAFCARPGYHTAETECPKREFLVRALLVLEHQVFLTPKHSQICLVLVQVHLFLGSAHACREIWQELGVKRTIVDSLAPILYDRLSTVAPVILDSSDDWGWDMAETLRGHFANSLLMRMPRRLIDAFETGSYGSIIDMPRYTNNLRFGCTRAMSLVEEVRADRLLGEPCDEFLNDDRFGKCQVSPKHGMAHRGDRGHQESADRVFVLVEVSDDIDLRDAVDYGSFPSWGSSASVPLYERLRLGPGITVSVHFSPDQEAPDLTKAQNTRAHLSLLAEAFHDVLLYRPPTVYKAGAAVPVMDHTFVTETMSQLSNSMSKFLAEAPAHCTPSETVYFETVHLLATLVPLCAGASHDRSVPVPSATMLAELIGAIQASLASQLDALPNPADSIQGLISTFSSFHRITMLRDTAMATKVTLAWILACNERERERDRSGGSPLPKDVVLEMKSLQSRATEALKQGRALISSLETQVANEAELGRRLREWAFGGDDGDDGLGGLVEDGTIKGVVESWGLNVQGWKQVKWEMK